MKLCRFGNNKLGLVEGDEVLDVSEALATLPALHYPMPLGDLLIRHLPEVSAAAQSLAAGAARYPLAQVKLLSPVANPSKIIAAPINYQSHIDLDLVDSEIAHKHTISHISHAGLFLKATSSLVGPGEGFEIQFP
jgi:2,4-didehydro-3-deoxy-L-rhamnonate hydrolase